MSDALPPRPDGSTGGFPPRQSAWGSPINTTGEIPQHPRPDVPQPPASKFSDDNPEDFTPPAAATYFTPEEPKKKANKALVAGGGILAVAAIGAGVAFAVNEIAPAGDYAYEALPGDGAFVYGEVNMDPSIGQKKSWLLLSKNLSDDDSAKSMRELVTEDLGDFAKVDPWFGERAAAVGYGDLGSDGLPDAFFAYQVKDSDAAATFSKSYSEPHKIIGSYLIVTESDEGQTVLDALAAKSGGPLIENETFKKDLDSVGSQNVAHGWVDLGPLVKNGDTLAADALAANPLSAMAGVSAPTQDTDVPEVTGRVILSAKVNDDGFEGKAIMRDVTVGGTKIVDATNFKSVEKELKNLPKGIAHLSVAGLDESLKSAWAEANASGDANMKESLQQLKETAADFAIALPEEFTKVVGSTTSVSILNSAGELGLFAHMAGADTQAWGDIVDGTGITNGNPSDIPVVTPSEDGVTVTYGDTSGQKIGDDKLLTSALVNLDSAGAAFLVDLDALKGLLGTMGMGYEDAAVEDKEDQLGVIGVTVGEDGSDMVVNGKWVLR